MAEQTGKVRRAILYTCKEYAVPSRNNETEKHPREVFEGDSHDFVMKALEAFATSHERCRLVLELDNGREIGIMPVLQDGCPAFGEPGCTNDSPVRWDLSLDVWPM